jgi:hydroxyacyl-ACP dehydratase HTD2-like protein with hotdog domain
MKTEITAESEEIQKNHQIHYKSLYSTKLENLDEMDNFLDR